MITPITQRLNRQLTITDSTNPCLTINHSTVQLIKTITPGYYDFDVCDIDLWIVYRRKPAKRMLAEPVHLYEIPHLVEEWNAEYGPAQYNAFPRGSRKRRKAYYTELDYNTNDLLIKELVTGKVYYRFNQHGELVDYVLLDLNFRKARRMHCNRVRYWRNKYFYKQDGEYHYDLLGIDSNTYSRVRRYHHDDI